MISGLSLIFQNLFVSIRSLGSLKFFDLNIKQVTKTVLNVCMLQAILESKSYYLHARLRPLIRGTTGFMD